MTKRTVAPLTNPMGSQKKGQMDEGDKSVSEFEVLGEIRLGQVHQAAENSLQLRREQPQQRLQS